MNDTIDKIISMIKKILGRFTLIHHLKMNKKRTLLIMGIKVGDFSAAVSIKIKKDMSDIKFILNGKPYSIIMVNNSFTSAIKVACTLIRGVLTDDNKAIKKMKSLTLTKQELRELRKQKHKTVAKLYRDKDGAPHKGPLVIRIKKNHDTDELMNDLIPVF